MKQLPIVHVIFTTYRPSAYVFLDTIRVGFPKAHIESHSAGELGKDIRGRLKHLGIHNWPHNPSLLHSEIIESIIRGHMDVNPLVILDGDMIFHQSCQDWEFDTMMAGYYVPLMWNEFAKCVSFPRIHTSFMWLKPQEIVETIKNAYPMALEEAGEYCPFDPFAARVMMINGKPHFWDACCGLHDICTKTYFNEEQIDSYTHLNSASFFEVMRDRMENSRGFEYLHTEGYKNVPLMKQYTRLVGDYYDKQHQKALTNGA